MPDLKKILFLPLNQEVVVRGEETILSVALGNKLPLDHSCGGMGTCGTCRVFVQKGLDKFKSRNELEAEVAADRGFSANERLACQNLAVDGVEIILPILLRQSHKMD